MVWCRTQAFELNKFGCGGGGIVETNLARSAQILYAFDALGIPRTLNWF